MTLRNKTSPASLAATGQEMGDNIDGLSVYQCTTSPNPLQALSRLNYASIARSLALFCLRRFCDVVEHDQLAAEALDRYWLALEIEGHNRDAAQKLGVM